MKYYEPEVSLANCNTVFEGADDQLLGKWASWLEAHGLDAAKLVTLIRSDGLIELPLSALPPNAEHWSERTVYDWFADRIGVADLPLRDRA